MRSLILAALLACASAIQIAPLMLEDSPTRVPGEYVVIFDTDITDDQVATHTHAVRRLMAYHGNKTNAMLGEYHIGSFRGYGARMDDKLRDLVRSMSHVKYVECSQVYHTMQASCNLQTGATWGIVRTTYHNRPTVEDYSYNNQQDGEGVDVYIIDTGIYLQHPDFGGRAEWGVDYIDNPSPRNDLNGHGTHVAGTVMSNTYGLAKKATSIAVRVLDQNGSGTSTGVINGINWVAGQHTTGKKSVANMSLGGGKSTSLNNAVDSAVSKGVNFAVAAGNEDQNACNVSPASATDAVTAGASDITDKFASFSNWGSCVDIIGPGVSITSTWNNGGTNTISGTSMASPHVAGVMAKYLSGGSYTPSQLKSLLAQEATKNMIDNIPSGGGGTPDLLVFRDCA